MLADRPLMQGDAELRRDAGLQIAPPPARHPVLLRVRTYETSEGQYRPRLIWRDPRIFRFDRNDLETPLMIGDQGQTEPLIPGKFIWATIRAKSGLALRSGLTRIAAFETEKEGFIPSLGDLIAVQHDMPAWGAQAEAVAWNAGSRTLTLSEPMIFVSGTHYVALRRRDGAMSGPWTVTAGATAFDVVLAVTPDITPDVGGDRERTHVAFGLVTTVLAKILKTTPRGLYRIGIEAVLEDPSVHTADVGVTAPAIATNGLPRAVTVPVVTGLIGRSMPFDTTRVLIAWQPSPGAETYHVEMAEGIDPADPNVTWTRVADTTATQYVVRLLAPAQSMIRVRGVGLTAGAWNATTVGTLIGLFWQADAAPFWLADPTTFWS